MRFGDPRAQPVCKVQRLIATWHARFWPTTCPGSTQKRQTIYRFAALPERRCAWSGLRLLLGYWPTSITAPLRE